MASGARADILLVTATKIETKAVLEAFSVSEAQAAPRGIDGRIYFDLGTVNGAHVMLTQCEMGAGGLGASLQSVGKGILALSPAAVVMVGIAFGMSEEKQKVGDVLVTERLRPYELQRIGTQGDGSVQVILRDDRPHSSPWLINLLRSSEVTWDGADLRFGTVLTGAKLVDNVDFRDQLCTLEPEAIGGEMEGAGLYVACHDAKIDWILVKAICDFADGQKAKDKVTRQALAAKNAASFVHHAIRFAAVDWRAHARTTNAATDGRNKSERAPGIRIKSVCSREGSVNADDGTGRGVDMEEVEAKYDVTASTGGRTSIPKSASPGQPPGVVSVVALGLEAARDVIVAGGDVHMARTTSAPVALHQLRAPPADFTGRKDELDELLVKLGPGGATISGLTGQGGVGKTALALTLAHHLAPRYPDAQIDIDLRGVTEDGQVPLAPVEVMTQVILAFEPTVQLPDTAERLSRVYRSVLHGKRALLLFDNVRDKAQVEPLIPPPGCVLLVTSRQRFTLPGLYSKNIDQLESVDAVTLVQRIAPRLDHAIAAELARLCGDLPLALRSASSALAEEEDLDPTDYLNYLRTAQARLEIVSATFSVSLELIDQSFRKLWYRLGVFPCAFDQTAAIALASGVSDAAQCVKILRKLRQHNLLEWDENTRHYRLHDLARLYAISQLVDEERYNAEYRHAEHFKSVAAEADALFLKGGSSVVTGLMLFDQERENIKAGQDWSEAHANHDDTAALLCTEYSRAATQCFFIRHRPREKIRRLSAALSAARRLGRRKDEAGHLGNLASAYRVLGETRQAIALFEEQLSISQQIADKQGEAIALHNMALAYARLGEYGRAAELCQRQFTVAAEANDARTQVGALITLASVHGETGQLAMAIDVLQHALVRARETGDLRGESAALGGLGANCRRLGETSQAIEYFERQLVISRQIGDRAGECQALGNLGLAYEVLGESRRAIDLYEQHLAIAREIDDRSGESNTLGNLGNIYFSMGDYESAISYYDAQRGICQLIGFRSGEANANWNLGRLHMTLGNLELAVALMQSRVDFFREIGHADAESHAAFVDKVRERLKK